MKLFNFPARAWADQLPGRIDREAMLKAAA
jgi:hypothetical protein